MAWNNRIPATSTISFFQLFFQFQLIWVKFRIPAKLRGNYFCVRVPSRNNSCVVTSMEL